jgi:hypothetical protein
MNRVTDPDDPNRCQGAAPDGQCMNEQEPGTPYCKVHGGRPETAATEEKKLYLLTEARYRTRLAQFAEHEQVKSLREEIALARMLIERRFDLIRNDNDLLNACGPINTMLLTVERLVKSAHTIEQNLGSLLSKPTVLKLGQEMVAIIIDELEGIDDYEAIVDRITARLVDTIAKASNPEPVK